MKVRINVNDVDEPPLNWNTAFTLVKATTDGAFIRGTPPDMSGRPPISDYDVRYCKTSPGPCDDANDSHWTEVLYIGAPTPNNNGQVELQVAGLEETDTHYKLQVRAGSHEGYNNWTPSLTFSTVGTLSFANNANISDMRPFVRENINKTLPGRARGGSDPYRYTLSAAWQPAGPPPGITLHPTNRKLSGQAAASQSKTEYRYVMTDRAGATAELRFHITVRPVAPKEVSAHGGHEQVTLTWNDPDDADVNLYQLSVYDGAWQDLAVVENDSLRDPQAPPDEDDPGSFLDLAAVEDNSSGVARLAATVTGLTNGQTYDFRLRALATGAGEAAISNPSDRVSGEPTANVLPLVSPAGPVSINIGGKAHLGSDIGDAFTVTDDNHDLLAWRLEGPDANLFDIHRSDWTTARIVASTPLEYQTPRSHTVTVIANDGFGDSNAVTVNITIREVGDVRNPEIGTADAPSVKGASSASLNVTWKPTSNQRYGYAEAPPTTYYDVRYCRVSSSCDHKQVDHTKAGYDWSHAEHTGTDTFVNIGGLQKGAEYEVQVWGGDRDGVGAWSEPGFGTPGDITDTPPAPHAPIVWASTSHMLGVAWSEPANAGPSIMDYRIAYRKYEKGVPTPWFYYHISDAATTSVFIGEDARLFAVNSNGEVSTTLAFTYRNQGGIATTAQEPDEETFTFTVHAHDGYGGSAAAPVTVVITGEAEAPANKEPVNKEPADDAPACNVEAGTPALPWTVSGIGYAECAVAPYSVSRQIIHFTSPVSGRIIITNTTPEGNADVRLKASDGKNVYENLVDRISAGNESNAEVEAGKGYALILLGSFDEQTITAAVRTEDGSPPPADNRAPVFAEGSGATRAVAENTASGTDIGAAVSASDADGDALTYSLGGADAASFAVGAATGQLGVLEPLDHESRASYSVTVTAADPQGATASIGVTISVTDTDEPPGKPDAPAVSSASSSGLSVSWNAPDNTGPAVTGYDVRYREGASGAWADAGHTGTATAVVIMGLEADTVYEVQARVASAEGTGPWSDSGQARTEADDANAPAITDVSVSHPATATLGDTVAVTVSVTGDVAAGGKPYRWVRQSNGNSWSTGFSSRAFQGWPTSPGTRSWEVFVTGSDGVEYGSGVFSITWEDPASAPPQGPAITDVSVSHPATAKVGETVVVTVSVTGEVAASGKPYRWVRVSNGNVWLTDSSSRRFQGWPTSPGTRTWEVFVTGSDGVEYGSGQFSITWQN